MAAETAGAAAAPTTTSRSRRPVLLGVGLAALGIALFATGLGLWGWVLARADACAELPREDLSLKEMGQLRRALDRYRADPGRPMMLTPRQTSFLLREQFGLSAWLTVAGDQVILEAREPYPGGCWNLSFRGRIDVTDGVAHARATDLAVGRLDLGWLVRPLPLSFAADDLGDPRASELLRHLTSVRTAAGWFVVQVDDPGWIR